MGAWALGRGSCFGHWSLDAGMVFGPYPLPVPWHRRRDRGRVSANPLERKLEFPIHVSSVNFMKCRSKLHRRMFDVAFRLCNAPPPFSFITNIIIAFPFAPAPCREHPVEVPGAYSTGCSTKRCRDKYHIGTYRYLSSHEDKYLVLIHLILVSLAFAWKFKFSFQRVVR